MRPVIALNAHRKCCTQIGMIWLCFQLYIIGTWGGKGDGNAREYNKRDSQRRNKSEQDRPERDMNWTQWR